ncbi:bifunctional DNA primase/polymerase [Zooshikella sp. RANM57]|uniref:bifunctional DNA primase/polymerase n=1 Tax=Zooshikella sp. RANM57 TaxID=3425863 RepID=UPI003D6E264B
MTNKSTEELAWELAEQGFTIIPLGSPFEKITEFFINERCNGDRDKAKKQWPKAPLINWRQYQDKNPTDAEIEAWTQRWPQANYGIITGKSVVVVDADSLEAVTFMESGKVGRTPWKVKTSKGKHYYFQYDDKVAIRNSSNTKTKIDIRGEGGYVVAPGSVHYTGVVYEWELDASWPINSIHDLPFLSHEDIAAIKAFNVEEKPVGNFGFSASAYASTKHDGSPVLEGGRNNAAASLAGQYITAGYDLKTVTQLVSQWNSTNQVPLPEAELNTTVASVALTHLNNNPGSAIPLVHEKPEPQNEYTPLVASEGLPDHLYKVPGVLGQLVDYANETAVKKQPALSVQAALALGSLVCGRYYKTDQENFSSLYFLNIAKSGEGKEHGKKVIETVLEAAGYGNLIGGSGYTSTGAVMSQTIDYPNHITVIDEFGKYLESSHRKGNSHREEAITQLIEIWSRCDGILRPQTYSTMSAKKDDQDKPLKVVNPAITLFGMTTPGTFYQCLTPQLVRDGFLGRFLIMESDLPMQLSVKPNAMPTPEPVLDWIRQVRTNLVGNLTPYKASHETPSQHVLMFDEKSLQLLTAFEEELNDKKQQLTDSELYVLLTRTREKAMRLALILALSEGSDNRVIHHSLTQWAIDYVRHLDYKLVDTVIRRVGGSEFETQLKACAEVVRKAGPKGLTESQARRKSEFARLTPKDEQIIVQALINRGLAMRCENINANKRGRPRNALIHCSYIEQVDAEIVNY